MFQKSEPSKFLQAYNISLHLTPNLIIHLPIHLSHSTFEPSILQNWHAQVFISLCLVWWWHQSFLWKKPTCDSLLLQRNINCACGWFISNFIKLKFNNTSVLSVTINSDLLGFNYKLHESLNMRWLLQGSGSTQLHQTEFFLHFLRQLGVAGVNLDPNLVLYCTFIGLKL